MAITTFTSGQILTAAQMNAVQANDYNQTVSTKTASYTLVAADKGTRVVMNSASATTITVNTSLFSAGDTLVLQNIGAGVCTVTAGTATVSTAGSLAIPQNGSGTLYFTSAGVSIYYPSAVGASSGLVQIRATAFSAVSSVSLEASTFTSTYYHYKMIFVVTSQSAAGALTYTGRFRAAGADDTTANYQTMSVGIDRTGTTNNGTGTDQTSLALGGSVSSTFPQFVLNVDFINPQQTAATQITGESQGGTSTQFIGRNVVAQFNLTTAFDSFSVIPSSGNITGRYFVYGYN